VLYVRTCKTESIPEYWAEAFPMTSVQFRPVIAPVGWGHLLRCFWNQVAEMYGLAQLGHLKQPRSPACPTNNEQLWFNSSLLYSGEASRPAKLQMWLTSSAKSATRVRWRPNLLRSTCENTTSYTHSSLWRMTWPAQPSLRSRTSWANDMATEQRKRTVLFDTWSCHLTPSMVRRQRDWNTFSLSNTARDSVQHSHPCNTVGRISVWNSFTPNFTDRAELQNTFDNDVKCAAATRELCRICQVGG